jgi:hypothetical protein
MIVSRHDAASEPLPFGGSQIVIIVMRNIERAPSLRSKAILGNVPSAACSIAADLGLAITVPLTKGVAVTVFQFLNLGSVWRHVIRGPIHSHRGEKECDTTPRSLHDQQIGRFGSARAVARRLKPPAVPSEAAERQLAGRGQLLHLPVHLRSQSRAIGSLSRLTML